MIYHTFSDIQLSALGFGTMRLPLIAGGSVKDIDVEQVKTMIKLAMDNGVNYFDTAWPYHDGESERVVAEALKEYPRDTYYLATKYPGHQIADTYDPADIFEKQLKKCDLEYFDFYLLHNVCETSQDAYFNPKWGIVEYFLEQRKNGRIKHLGFSSHGRPDNLRHFLDTYGDEMEFCQIQLNYLDWTLQNANEKYKLLTERNIPVWVMEPLRGGKLASLAPQAAETLYSLRPDEKIPAWAFRYLQTLPNVVVTLSGMSNVAQMEDNLKTFSTFEPLDAIELDALYQIAESLKNSLPCTACRYCCKDCPKGLDIPTILSYYNDMRFANSFSVGMGIDAMPQDKQPSACIACGKCKQICPQSIDIPTAMADFSAALAKIPHWADICKERANAQK